MPTYHLDVTVSDRYLDQPHALALREWVGRAPGFQEVDTWHAGPVHFWRFTLLMDRPSLADLFDTLKAMRSEFIGEANVPLVTQLAIRDVRFSLEEALPYRYRPLPSRLTKKRPASGATAG